jgi:hypothetical protein
VSTTHVAVVGDFAGEDFRVRGHGQKLTPARARGGGDEAHGFPGGDALALGRLRTAGGGVVRAGGLAVTFCPHCGYSMHSGNRAERGVYRKLFN